MSLLGQTNCVGLRTLCPKRHRCFPKFPPHNDGCEEDDPLSTSVIYIIGMRLRVSIMRRPWIQTIDETTNECVWTKANSQSFRASKSMA